MPIDKEQLTKNRKKALLTGSVLCLIYLAVVYGIIKLIPGYFYIANIILLVVFLAVALLIRIRRKI
jgi:preprotein translocase subunit SecD